MPASPIRKLMPLADEARRRGVSIYHLNIGQPDLPTPESMRRRLKDVPEVLAYSPSGGTPEYVESLQTYYGRLGIELSPGEIVATTGGSEALLFAFMACADAGDEILTVEPFYTNYRSFAAMAGLTIRPARDARRGRLPPSSAGRVGEEAHAKGRASSSSATRTTRPAPSTRAKRSSPWPSSAAITGSSSSPTRFTVSSSTTGGESESAHSLGFADLVVVVDSLSKRYSACGIRLGSLITRNAEIAGAATRMAQGRLSPPGLAQLIAPGALELGPEYARGVVTEYQKRRDMLFRGLGEDSRRLPAEARGRVLFRGAPPRRQTATTSRPGS